MRKRLLSVLACMGTAGGISACATAHKAESVASDGMRGGRNVASAGAAMVKTTVNETYNGLGGAVRAPLRDLNMMQEAIPVALMKARESVYDTQGLTSCEAVAAEIQALDITLGPDVDTPRVESQRNRSQRLASAAADGAVNAARGALDHYIPVRGVVRQLSGARKYEKETARALLAGNVRRGFLKAIGMQQNCAWPAAPITFKPNAVAPNMQLAVAQGAPTAEVGALKDVRLVSAASASPSQGAAQAPPTTEAAVVPTAREAAPPVGAGPGAAPVVLAAAKTEDPGVNSAAPLPVPLSSPAAPSRAPALGFAGAAVAQPSAAPGLR